MTSGNLKCGSMVMTILYRKLQKVYKLSTYHAFLSNPTAYYRALRFEPFFLLSYRKSGNTWLRGLLECYLKIGSKRYIYEHEHSIFYPGFPEKIYKVHRWHEIDQDLPIIYVIRDPRETLLSLYLWDHFDLNYDGDPYERVKLASTEFFLEKAEEIYQHVACTESTECLIVRYEDIPARETWQQICEYLGVRFSETHLENCLRRVSKSSTREYHSSQGKYIQQANLPNNNKWESYLSREHISVIEQVCAPIIRRFGYDF